MDGNVAAQAVDEGEPPLLLGVRLRPVCAVHQLGDGHDGQTDLDLAVRGLYLFEDLADGVAPAFGGDDDAGVEDQSHAGGFHGLRLATISSMSAAKSGSRTGASPVSSSCFFASAMHSEMDRRGGAAARRTAAG